MSTREQGGRGFGKGHTGPGRGPMMGRPVEKAKDFKGTLKRLAGYFGEHKFKLGLVFFLAILSAGFGVLGPKILGLGVNSLYLGVKEQKVDLNYLRKIALGLGSLYIFSAFFTYLQQYTMAGVSQETVFRLREDVNDKLSRLPLKYYDSRTYGEILSRVTNDIDNISRTLQQSITQLITSAISFFGIVIMMIIISPSLSLFTFLTLLLYAIVTRSVAMRSQGFFVAQQRILGELNGHVEEMFTGHKIIKAFGREERSLARFDAINDELYTSSWKANFISGIIMPMTFFISNLGYVLVAVMGGMLAARGVLTLGDVQAFLQYSRQFSFPITQAANIANIIQSAVASAERVFELFDETEEIPDPVDAVHIEDPTGEVAFCHVKFNYEEGDFHMGDMNIDVAPGQTVAIVGPTGAGKTTLVNLLMRFYEIADGNISVDGVDIRKMTRGNLRNIFGMVLQDTWLFNGTLRENIAYGREGASDDEVVLAAEAAHADPFIRAFPEGYDTLINEEASNISAGQKQLLTIARAILADPAILILDEATSSVDTRTEIQIQKAMAELMEGRTSFVIAHRLSTIRDADLILVMNHGNIIEKGTHEELLLQKGFYADLYNSQFRGQSNSPSP